MADNGIGKDGNVWFRRSTVSATFANSLDLVIVYYNEFKFNLIVF